MKRWFNPAAVSTTALDGLGFHLVADDGLTPVGSGPDAYHWVSRIDPADGETESEFSIAAGTRVPTLNVGVLNGHNTLTWDSGDCIVLGGDDVMDAIGARDDNTFVFVVELPAHSANYKFIFDSGPDATVRRRTMYTYNGQLHFARLGAGGGTLSTAYTAGWQVISAVTNSGANSKLQINSGTTVTGDIGQGSDEPVPPFANDGHTWASFLIGSHWDITNLGADADFAEIYVVATDVGDTKRAAIVSELRTKYGI